MSAIYAVYGIERNGDFGARLARLDQSSGNLVEMLVDQDRVLDFERILKKFIYCLTTTKMTNHVNFVFN